MLLPSIPRSLLAVALLLALPSFTAAQFVDEVRIDLGDPAGATFSSSPAVCVDGERVFVAWVDTRFAVTEILFNRSDDRGRTWRDPAIRATQRPLTSNGGAGAPSLICRGDLLFMTWRDERDGVGGGHGSKTGDIYFARSLDGGLTWEADQRISSNPPGSQSLFQSPVVHATDDGQHVYVVWVRDFGSAVAVNVSHDAGASWRPVELLFSDPGSIYSGSLALSGDDVYLAWYGHPPGGYYDIYFNVSHDNGDTWKPAATRIDTGDAPNQYDSWSPKLAASGDWVYATWYDERYSASGEFTDVYFNSSSDRGETWGSSATRINTDPPNAARSRIPRIAAEGANVYICWEDHRNYVSFNGDDAYVRASQDHGVSWNPTDTVLNPVPGDDWGQFPKVAAGENGYASVVWEGQPWKVELSYTYDGGVTWSPALRLDANDPATTQSDPYAVAADGGIVHGVFSDRRDGASDVYCASGTIPYLSFEGVPAPGESVHFSIHEAAESGAEAVVLVSLTGPAGPGGGIPVPGTGLALDLIPDARTQQWLNLGVNVSGSISNGTARTPTLAMPNLPPGTAIWAAAATFDPLQGAYLSATRTIQFLTQ